MDSIINRRVKYDFILYVLFSDTPSWVRILWSLLKGTMFMLTTTYKNFRIFHRGSIVTGNLLLVLGKCIQCRMSWLTQYLHVYQSSASPYFHHQNELPNYNKKFINIWTWGELSKYCNLFSELTSNNLPCLNWKKTLL